MKKNLLFSAIFGFATVVQAVAADIIKTTPEGTLHAEVYGTSASTYLVTQGGFGSFSDNDGYCTSIVINGNDIYVHNIIRECSELNSWVKGTVVSDGIVEFDFPQPVGKRLNGETLYISMMKASVSGLTTTLIPNTDNPKLRMSWDGSKLTQIIPVSDTPSRFDGMIGLTTEDGTFQSYGERDVTYTIWNESPVSPAETLTTTAYTASYNNEWNETYSRRVELGIDGNTAWLKGLSALLPQAWIKGEVNSDGSITFASEQYLGIYENYFIFFYGADDKSTSAGKKYDWLDNVTITKNGIEWEAGSEMIINIGKGHPWFGNGIANLKLTEISALDPVPAAPEWGEPEWSDDEGMGIGDFMLPSVDINGQALDVNKLYYRLYFDGELAPGDELRQFGKEYDDIMYIGDNWHFAFFYEALKSIGVQSVYKDGDKEYTSEIITHSFGGSGIDGIASDQAEVVAIEYYNMTGMRLINPEGLCIRRTVYSDGKVDAEKVFIK